MGSMEHEHHHHGAEPNPLPQQEHAQHGSVTGTAHGNPAHGASGHDHHRMMIADFKKRLWISLAITVPVLLLSPMIHMILGFSFTFPGSFYVLFALSSVVYFHGGWPFLKGAWDELRGRSPGMMTLIAVAITVAWLYSSAVVFGLKGEDFFWELVTLIDIMLLGHWIEMRSVLGASRSLELLVSMMPAEAHLVHGDHVMDVKLDTLKVGDVIVIKPGEKIPADGTVAEGESYVNESMLTGESVPVQKAKGDKVIGGSVNGNGSLRVKVLHTGADSYLSKVITLVNEAQKSKSRTQHLADRAAKWLTYIALATGAITFTVWLLLGAELVYALERMVTVMVISCPHALGLAIPLVVAISTAMAAQHGLLIRNRTAFENARKITTILFDKTGTLTMGDFGVVRVVVHATGVDEKEILRLAAALEQSSEHPIATGIMKKAKADGIALAAITGFEAITGKGVQAMVDGARIAVVSPGYLKEMNIAIPGKAGTDAAETVIHVLRNDALIGSIALADAIRPTAKAAIDRFRKEGIKVIMATGDNAAVAKSVSDALGLDGFHAEVLPHKKVELLIALQGKGEFVAMTGDGVNDAPALAQADVGIAVGSGTDVAAETADIILVNSDPNDILELILFGKATYRKMIQNLVWATGYNAFAIPMAAGVFYASGFVMGPAMGAVLMSASTVVVAVNAQLLKRSLKISPEPAGMATDHHKTKLIA